MSSSEQTKPTTKDVIDVPEDLSPDETIEFVRAAIRGRGCDPDTGYLIGVDWPDFSTACAETTSDDSANVALTELDLSKLNPDFRRLYEDMMKVYLDASEDGS